MKRRPAGVQVEHVSKTFSSGATEVHAVNDLSFEIPRGAFWSLIGPSSSGKSTVLHLSAGLTPPTSGSIRVDDDVVVNATPDEAARLRLVMHDPAFAARAQCVLRIVDGAAQHVMDFAKRAMPASRAIE